MSRSISASPFSSNSGNSGGFGRTGIRLLLLLIAGSPVLLTGCSSIRYFFQATQGQLSLLNHAKPIAEVIRDEKTPPRIRALLSELGPIKKFSESNGLKPTTNYTEYVKLDRPAAVWVVSGCEQLRFQSKEWHFPVVGSFPYLGWFDLQQAKEFAAELRAQGWDVDLRGARAYSTLGWFRDAVLSTMIPDGEEALGELVNVVLHESVHATIYIKGQAYFNESIASFVADRLTGAFLRPRPGESRAYFEAEKEGKARQKRLHDAYEKLQAVYSSTEPDGVKLEKKKALLDSLKKELGFTREITNATLLQFKTYSSATPEFEALWKACGGDGQRFLKALAKLTPESFKTPQQEDLSSVLLPVVQANCAG